MTLFIEVVGVLAALTTAVFFLPQAVRVVRHGTDGVSTITFQIVTVLSAIWLVYGAVESLPALIWGNVPIIVCALVVLGCCRRDGAPWRDLLPVIVGCAAAATAVWILFGPAHIGWVSVALGTAMRIPQLRAVRASQSIEGVSATTWWIGIVNNSLWAVYAIPQGDYRIPIACAIQIVLAAILLREISRIRRQGALETVIDEVEHP